MLVQFYMYFCILINKKYILVFIIPKVLSTYLVNCWPYYGNKISTVHGSPRSLYETK